MIRNRLVKPDKSVNSEPKVTVDAQQHQAAECDPWCRDHIFAVDRALAVVQTQPLTYHREVPTPLNGEKPSLVASRVRNVVIRLCIYTLSS